MKDKFVNIKIREEFRDMLKDYSKHHGYKMYALLEVKKTSSHSNIIFD